MERDIFICECNSLEHQCVYWLDKDTNILYVNIHLNNSKTFLQRLIYGIKYIFGYKSRFGAWDEFIFNNDDLEKLKTHLNQS